MRLDSICRQILAQAQCRTDAASTATFLRDLTYIYEQTYDIIYTDLLARTILSVDGRPGPGAATAAWRQFDRFGTVKFGDMSAEDAPNVEIGGVEFETRITSILGSYQYTYQDIREAQMAGLPLETRKAEACRRAFEQGIEALAVLGDAAASYSDVQSRVGFVGSGTGFASDPIRFYGFANQPNITNAAVPVGTLYAGLSSVSGSTLQTGLNWTLDSTPVAAILADVNAMQKAIVNITQGAHKPNELYLPTPIYSKLGTQARSSTFTTDSVLQYIQTQSPWLKKIVLWPSLDTAGLKQDNATAGPRIMMAENTPTNFQLIISQEFEQFPPQMLNYAFKVPCHMRCGGVKMPYPKSVCYLDGAAG